MKKNNSSLLHNALIGIGIGIPCTLICMTIIIGYNEIIEGFLIWTVASALFGIFSGLCFDKFDKLNLPAAMALHCLGCLLVATTAAFLCGFDDNFFTVLLNILPMFLIVYVVIFLFCITVMKLEEKKINKALDKE